MGRPPAPVGGMSSRRAGSVASVWVMDLPWGTTSEQVKDKFDNIQGGKVKAVHVRTIQAAETFAYVEFFSVAQCEAAAEVMHGSTAFGSPVRVLLRSPGSRYVDAMPREVAAAAAAAASSRSRSRSPEGRTELPHAIMVENVPEDMLWLELREAVMRLGCKPGFVDTFTRGFRRHSPRYGILRFAEREDAVSAARLLDDMAVEGEFVRLKAWEGELEAETS